MARAARDVSRNVLPRTCLTSLLLAKDDASLSAKRARLAVPAAYRGYAVTVPQAIDLVGQYERAGAQLFICSVFENDWESLALLAEDVIPHFRA